MMMSGQKAKVRFAPSPTGPLTLGGARTALFNWLYARHTEGEFLLRIEDTDIERSEEKYEKDIKKSLEWLGLKWDGQIYRQSERLDLYKKYMNQLIEEEKAYWCFCSKEQLEEEKEAQMSQGLSPKYSGRCRSISRDEAEERLENGESAVLRFKMPVTNISFQDVIRGKVEFDTERTGDFVIATSLDRPLYNFAVVVDDHQMDITHVIRGEDHISNTPKQLAIYNALDFEPPRYAHLPLILSKDGGKMSKRKKEGGISGYKQDGYVSDALFNFMALIGWHPKEDREVISRQEAIDQFTLRRVQKGGASMNLEKLEWYNGYYIRNKETEDLLEEVKDFIPDKWLEDKDKLLGALDIEKERMKRLSDFKKKGGFFFDLPDYDEEMVVWKDESKASAENLKKVYKFIENLSKDKFTFDNINDFLEDLSDEVGGKGEIYWPLRVALSGKKASPGPVEIAMVLKKEETLRRIKIALDKIEGLI